MTTAAHISPAPSHQANPHYLKRVVDMSKGDPVVTQEDIFDERGMKLLPKGARVDDSVCERLLRFKLRRPLESSIGAEHGVTVADLVNLAEEMLAAHSGLTKALATLNADVVAIRLLKRMRLGDSGRLLLALQNRENSRLRHAMLVALIAAGLGHHARLGEEALESLVVAGVLHDIGELYIAPAILNKDAPLSVAEWRQVASHPLLGAMVVSESMHYPPEVSRYVAEHHERRNGYGYPRLLKSPAIAPGGAALATAEAVAAVLAGDNDAYRLGCALRLVSEEYAQVDVAFADRISRSMREELGGDFSSDVTSDFAVGLADRVGQSLERSLTWLDGLEPCTGSAKAVIEFVSQRLLSLRKAAHSLGIGTVPVAEIFAGGLLPEESNELRAACSEILRRLSELAGIASLHPEARMEDLSSFFTELAARCRVPVVTDSVLV